MTKSDKHFCKPGSKILIGHKLIDRITLLRLAFEPVLLDVESEFDEDPAFVLTRKEESLRLFRSRVFKGMSNCFKGVPKYVRRI